MTFCSEYARDLGEPLAGTAALAQSFLVLEQPGPWGAKALLSSHLDHSLGVALTERSGDVPVTVVLARRIGHHADDHVVDRPRNVWVGHVGPGEPWLEHTLVDDPAALLDLDLGSVAAGVRPMLGSLVTDPLLLVCTNSKRDRCCALLGRPVAAALAAELPGQVWEASHLGGHRLAPTLLSLPDGFMYGGPLAATRSVAACRGRTSLRRAAQAAELAVLASLGAARPYALSVEPAGADWVVTGRQAEPATSRAAPTGPVRVRVSGLSLEPPRPESCGKSAVATVSYAAAILA